MRFAIPFLIPALILPLAAAQALPLAQRVQQGLRLPDTVLVKLQAELAAAPEQAQKAYWQGLVAYARLGQTKDPKVSTPLLAEATKYLEGRADADSLGLLGSLYGLAISLHPEQAMELVSKAMACFGRAKQVAPGNPRVRLFEAIHMLQTPEAFGGGPEVALPLLEASAALAGAEPANANPWTPSWGKAESLAWLALAEARSGRMAQAKIHFDRCQKLDPAFGFAQNFVAPLIK